ncbi:type II toxin-antitoxin system HicB family antitoxin, partial [Enterobacter cloacae complex sp. YD24/O97A9]|jgi:predicted HicB family RNase H-like nuclease|uniref:type II toxin-antitoxin system HicB family antitoxin n=1 Tax=Enterobacter cloacae complex sp. YD24/O97A9 TaxID=3379949 RepID=UPI003B81E900
LYFLTKMLCVDLYLQSCVEDGKEPDTPFKGVFNVRLDPELHRRVAEMAMEEDLSLNAFVNKALEKEVSNHRAGA